MDSFKLKELKRLIPRIIKMNPNKPGVGRISHEILTEIHRLENNIKYEIN